MRDLVLDERGEVRPLVNVYVDGERTHDLTAPVGDDARIRIVAAIAGGAGASNSLLLGSARGAEASCPCNSLLLGLVRADLGRDPRDLARRDLLLDLLDLVDVLLRHLGADLAEPTPSSFSPKVALPPPLRAAWTALIVRKTAASTPFCALVRMCGPRNDWSASTPIPQRSRSPAAFSAPRPQPPATWKTTFEPRAIWFRASSLHFALVVPVLRVVVDGRDPRRPPSRRRSSRR